MRAGPPQVNVAGPDQPVAVRCSPTRSGSPALVGCSVLAAVGMVAGLLAGRSDVAAFGAAFAAVAAAAVALAESPMFDVRVVVDADRVLEGDVVSARVLITSSCAVDRVDVFVELPFGFIVVTGTNPAAIALAAGEEHEIALALRADQWGLHRLGRLAVRARDRTGLLRWEAAVEELHAVRVLPGPSALDDLVRPARTRVHAGNQVARSRGEGTEFADIRPFACGDLARDVNWRLTARRGEPWVNLRHPERSTDVVILLDTFAEAAMPDGVRAAAALATAHLDQRDRVGYVGFGGSLRWLEPGGGRRQEYRMIDALITTQVYASDAWRTLRAVPQRTIPPNALLLAVSPLHDQRVVGALGSLRSRGIDVAVLEIVLPQEPAESKVYGPFAERLWELQRRTTRSQFVRLGVPVSSWDGSGPLAEPVNELMAFRRRIRSRAG